MKTLLFVLGTRPEAIKLAPVILFFKDKIDFKVLVCNTGQHRELTNEVLEFFVIKPDYDLRVMTHDQSLVEVQSKIMLGVDKILAKELPQFVFVQGDTTTAFAAGLTAFYRKIKIVHIEAGLRSWDKFSPFPEEINRVFLSKIADYHFAPTDDAMMNLQNEGIKTNLWNVGNTVIDALNIGLKLIDISGKGIIEAFKFLDKSKKTVLLTTHRRENFGQPLLDICKVVKSALEKYPDVQFVCPVHPNPNVTEVLYREFENISNVFLISPLTYPHLISLLSLSHLVMSDSGGIQEEAPSLGKPVIVLRDNTERMEGVNAGTAMLAGNSYNGIWSCFCQIMDNELIYKKMALSSNPYGDGDSSKRIFEIISKL